MKIVLSSLKLEVKSNVKIDIWQLYCNGYSQWLNIKGEKQFYRDINSIDISDAGLQS